MAAVDVDPPALPVAPMRHRVFLDDLRGALVGHSDGTELEFDRTAEVVAVDVIKDRTRKTRSDLLDVKQCGPGLFDPDRDLEPVLQFHDRPPDCPAAATVRPARRRSYAAT